MAIWSGMTVENQYSVLAMEPYAAPSHMAFLRGLQAHSQHRWELLTLPPRKWKWRMRTSALHFAAALAVRPRPGGDEGIAPGGAALDPDGSLFP